MIFGGILIVLGALFLAQNLGFLPWLSWSTIWPVLLIAWGVCLIFGRKAARCCFPRPR